MQGQQEEKLLLGAEVLDDFPFFPLNGVCDEEPPSLRLPPSELVYVHSHRAPAELAASPPLLASAEVVVDASPCLGAAPVAVAEAAAGGEPPADTPKAADVHSAYDAPSRDSRPTTASEGAAAVPAVTPDADELPVAVWLADCRRATALLEANADINAVDAHGSAPLMLAVELLPRARDYERMVRYLLERDADPRQRSANGWSPLDVAVSRGDEELVRLLFERSQRSLRRRWEAKLEPLVESLRELPDFECRIRWEFESPVIPLVGKIAPSDIVLIRKRGASLRLDSTLASWKPFRLSKRRELTTLFRPDAGGLGGHSGGGGSSGSTAQPTLCMLNHNKQVAVDITAGLDHEEASAVVEDLVAAEAMQWDMNLDQLQVAQSTSWFGQALGPTDINGWKAHRFDVNGTLGLSVCKKGNKGNSATFEEYFGKPLPAHVCLPELQEEFRRSEGAAARTGKAATNGNGNDLQTSEKASTAAPLSFEESASQTLWTHSERAKVAALMQEEDMEDLLDMDCMSDASEVLAQWPDPSALGRLNDKVDSRDMDALLTARSSATGGGDFGDFPLPPPSARSAASKADGKLGGLAKEAKAGSNGSAAGGVSSAEAGRKCSNDTNGKVRPTTTGDKVGKTSRAVGATVWLATDFPMSMQQFLPVLEALSAEHAAMRRLKELLMSKGVQEAGERAKQSSSSTRDGHVFPVKVSVPLNLAIRALAHFELFELRQPGELPEELFEVPKNYEWQARREAQKTLNRRRKRMFLAHLAM
eukprot:TRINITY_DN103945_c0_g1_i1.p1 TRINITY_DN103945_c0_g1~~TRINITY_DN103945_c0_g1_i1.p1  ORF type:complete len:809 (-),score=215.10 TRINITY_DN103945_c0_g1_i1:71-2356(-)